MDFQIVFYVMAGALILLGLIGVVLPALPGLPLIYAGMLLAAWAEGFHRIGVWTLVVLGLLTALSVGVDFAATAMGAKRVGASRLALLGAAIGTVVGLFFSLVGVFVAPFIGAVIGELLHRRKLAGADLGHATKVGLGTWLGILFGVVLKLALAFAMIGLFLIAWFFCEKFPTRPTVPPEKTDDIVSSRHARPAPGPEPRPPTQIGDRFARPALPTVLIARAIFRMAKLRQR